MRTQIEDSAQITLAAATEWQNLVALSLLLICNNFNKFAAGEFDSHEALYKLLDLVLVASEACGGELYFGLLDLFALPTTAILCFQIGRAHV